MTRVLGLDPSLTGAGVATIVDAGHVHVDVDTIGSAKISDHLIDRHRRIRDHATAVLGHNLGEVTLAVVEAPAFSRSDPGTWERAGLWWRLVSRLVNAWIPVVEVSPSALKKFACNKGNANKTEVVSAMARLWPDVEVRDDNGWDALALAHIGAARLGLDVPSRAHHAAVLDRIAWPDNLPERR